MSEDARCREVAQAWSLGIFSFKVSQQSRQPLAPHRRIGRVPFANVSIVRPVAQTMIGLHFGSLESCGISNRGLKPSEVDVATCDDFAQCRKKEGPVLGYIADP